MEWARMHVDAPWEKSDMFAGCMLAAAPTTCGKNEATSKVCSMAQQYNNGQPGWLLHRLFKMFKTQQKMRASPKLGQTNETISCQSKVLASSLLQHRAAVLDKT